MTLGNFRYRKMSLVRDYAALLENDPDNPGFDAIFSLRPRVVDPTPIELPPLEDRFPVLTCDPTQTSAIARARAGKSYIIQGPPGTGKSQTIANLIADYISRGQRVLFVCEKRAAIDVVYHRLQQNGLHGLCALIHDSQEDKKEFIMDLKQTYEAYLESAGKPGASAERQRQELLRAVQHNLKPLQHFHDAMCSPAIGARVPLRRLVERLIALRDRQPELSPLEKERIPPYVQWCEHREGVERLTAALKEIHGDPIFAKHPLKHLTTRLVRQDRPLEKVTTHLQNAEKLLDSLEQEFQKAGLKPDEYDTLEKSWQLVRYADEVRFLAEKELLSLLQPDSESAKKFSGLVKEHRKRAKELEEAGQATKSWRHKLSLPELITALEQARAFQKRTFSFLTPAWWRLRSTLRNCYDFRSHQIQPSWTQILESLAREYQAQGALRELEIKAQRVFRFRGNADEFIRKVQELRHSVAQYPAEVRNLERRLLDSGKADATLLRVAELKQQAQQLAEELTGFLDDVNGRTFAELKDQFALIEESLDDLPDFLVSLTEAAGLPDELLEVLRRLPLTTVELEAAMARRTWDEACRVDRALHRFTGQVRGHHVHQLQEFHDQLYGANAALVCERVRQRFLEHVRVSETPHAQLASQQKELKTAYNRGRRDLEHEFGKSMRYRSIRDLVAGESGLVIQDLKPVWLMSPVSVSDTLPLDAAHFDVVIFDEASQITLEEAVPCLFRAAQVIVVGDQMQLPPTNFFSAKHGEEEEFLHIQDETSGEKVEYDLETNSFLAQASRILPSTMLGWHYRSRSESLISYSNAAFYHGQLLTVPEKTLPSPDWAEIRVESTDEGAANVDILRERPVSFHFLENGVYFNRRNAAEADYIAHLVRELLSRDSFMGERLSIGIIAFSEAQQGEIQDALNRLGQEDPSFRDRLEAEFEREENGQFMGLLVKNLENIQGDERDVVILSVCYGRGQNGKMLMNFGPINQSGGEKRLNVAFSRAKQHMALISSVHYPEITNDYNDGARCLKNYLRYAQAVSVGDLDTARRTLREIRVSPGGSALETETPSDVVVQQLAADLRARGYEIDLDVGQSNFRCDLAVRCPGERMYRAAVLVDTEEYYRQNDILERDVMRPRLLQGFGWRIKHILAKDWYHNRSAIVNSLIRFIEQESDEENEEHPPSDSATGLESQERETSEPEAPSAAVAEPLNTEWATQPFPAKADRQTPDLATVVFTDPSPPPSLPLSAGAARMEATETPWTRYFEFSGGTSNKFWEITVNGRQHTVRFGRIGSVGQQKTKIFADMCAAERDARRLINEKLAKGYVESK